MALIACPECSKEFSDKAPACPNCAYALSLDDRITLNCYVDWEDLCVKGESSKEDKQKIYYYSLVIEHCPDNALVRRALRWIGKLCDDEKEYGKAMEYYTLAAEKGDGIAANNLGVMFNDGKGVVQNKEKALVWYEQAMKNGNMEGIVYFNAAGTSYSLGRYDKSFEYYTVAAEKGHAGACCNLATAYLNGEGTFKNPQQALKWYQKAIELGGKNAVFLRSAGIAAAQLNLFVDAFNYYFEAAKLGDGIALNNLGMCYYNGQGTERDLQLAANALKAAVETGQSKSAHRNLRLVNEVIDEEMQGTRDCPNCKGKKTMAYVRGNQGGFSGGKAVAGALLLGPLGIAAGALGNKQWFYECRKCGHRMR